MGKFNNLLCVITIIVMGIICSACPFYMDDADMGEEHVVNFVNESNDEVYVSIWPSPEKDEFTMETVFERVERFDFIWVKVGKTETVEVESVSDYSIEENWWYQVIVISQHTLDSYSKEEIIEKNIYDKKYVLRCSALERMNFKIVYKGSEYDERGRLANKPMH